LPRCVVCGSNEELVSYGIGKELCPLHQNQAVKLFGWQDPEDLCDADD
jgi:hypothetical protein